MSFNPNMMKMFQTIMSSQNPQQMVMNMMEGQAGNNPVLRNLLSLAKSNDSKGIEQVARNMMKERGLDFDKEFNNFRNNLRF